MIRTARALAAAGALAIMGIGARFLVRPEAGLAGFGVTAGDERALTAIKGVRDISSGLVLLTVWRWGSPRALGACLLAGSSTPWGDMVIVLRRGGSPATAFGVHGLTAAVMDVAAIRLLRAQPDAPPPVKAADASTVAVAS
ncbi:MAG TPA: DUF4267 domain-containing protein [Kribbellaceae bacterium]|nr:DUF4267 domain-containing protein [Kribbellaceae bacterium]